MVKDYYLIQTFIIHGNIVMCLLYRKYQIMHHLFDSFFFCKSLRNLFLTDILLPMMNISKKLAL